MKKSRPRTGIPMPPPNLMDGLAAHREHLGGHLSNHRSKHVIPPPNALDDLHRDRANLTRDLVNERHQAFAGRKVFNPKCGWK